MTDIYIVVKVGHEGIDHLGRGFTDKKGAKEFLLQQRNKYDNPSRDDDEMHYYFFQKDELKYTEEKLKEWVDGENRRWCIQRDSGGGFSCVCKELGVNLSDDLVLY